MKFALVEPGAAGTATADLELSLASGERLYITRGADASTLRMVLSVLREQ